VSLAFVFKNGISLTLVVPSVLIGNGCSAAQIMPEIKDKCKSLTQIARSRQSILRRIPVPDGPVLWFLLRYIPGLHFLLRAAIFFITESYFKISDIKKGAKLRKDTLTDNLKYIKEVAPEKYWEALRPDFDIGAKVRPFVSRHP
jgi:cation diffusion facilitator CzcD-associated flavoprotein CzcO